MTLAEMVADGWQRSEPGFLLTPDPRRAGAGVQGPRVALPATSAPARGWYRAGDAPAHCLGGIAGEGA